ncbi:hypothetical protein QE152_g12605 [Popillia japonica]|uniref:Uncharacterized protein n=1 Tax=Popillia japonica TaxID=7064 RepID=A0AAW1LR97_POPJA
MPTASRSVLSPSGTSPPSSSAYTYSNTEPPSPFQAECHRESHSSSFQQHTNVPVAASQPPSNFSIINQGHNTNGNSQGGNSVDNSEFKIFGQHVAAQLEKLPVVQALQPQEQILSLLTRARLEQLRDHSSMPTASRSVLSPSGTSPPSSSAYTYSNTEPPSPFQAECHRESHSSSFQQHTNVPVAASQPPSNFSIINQGHNTNGNSQGGVGLMTYFNSCQDN